MSFGKKMRRWKEPSAGFVMGSLTKTIKTTAISVVNSVARHTTSAIFSLRNQNSSLWFSQSKWI